MFSIWTLAFVTGIYLLTLFLVATVGSRIGKPPKSVYALALGVHCTSWAFFGTTTQAVTFGWAFVPTYLGVILVMLFGYASLRKIAHICRQHNITSLAELIGMRYRHAYSLSGFIVLLCFIGVIPYIALQLDAISSAISLMTSTDSVWSDSLSFYVAALMAMFAIFFGTRSLDLTQKRDGLMLTIAFESLIKLFALCTVGLYCVYIVHDGWYDLVDNALSTPSSRNTLTQAPAHYVYTSHIVLGICSMFCLPRQFHINFVENNEDGELERARWLFPLYLCLMTLFILPIALSGQFLFAQSSANNITFLNSNADTFVLSIPLSQNEVVLSLVAYIGGLAASTSMVIVASLALGNMVANNLITPFLLSIKSQKSFGLRRTSMGVAPLNARQLLRIRQLTIIALMLVAYWYHVNVGQSAPLVKSGTIAIAFMAQAFPAILCALYWPRSRGPAILAGMIFGTFLVLSMMLYPAILSSYYFADAPSDRDFADAIFLSLASNGFIAIFGSLTLNRLIKSNDDKKLSRNPFDNKLSSLASLNVEFGKLHSILGRIIPDAITASFMSQMKTKGYNSNDLVPASILHRAEAALASHIGNAGARILMRTIAHNDEGETEEITELMEQASQSFQFNHEVLLSSIAHLPQAISVIDSNLNLVAWNQQYENLFDYPPGLLQQGKSIAAILRFNYRRGLLKNSKSDDPVSRRLQLMQSGEAYQFVRHHSHNKTIEITGNPLPGGGYITSYTDITQYIQIQNQLQASKQELEVRVRQRTKELEAAKLEAESANRSKSKFLAATGHDLMQPFNAASLFASLLNDKLTDSGLSVISEQLLQSLESADELLGMLIDISKLESGKIIPVLSHFALDDLLQQLVSEFSVIAQQKNIRIRYQRTSLWVHTDRRLLSRIIQNLLANAIRYTDQGIVLLGTRRRKNSCCEIMVIDTGRGIAKDDQALVFDEFKRLEQQDSAGLGLGLTIVERTSKLLGIEISLHSTLGRGTAFGLKMAWVDSKTNIAEYRASPTSLSQKAFLQGKIVLVLENDKQVSIALCTLFKEWGAAVWSADCEHKILRPIQSIDIIIADYHLNNGENGIDLATKLESKLARKPIMILSSADRSEYIQELAIEHQMLYLPKPVKPAALKRLIQTKLRS